MELFNDFFDPAGAFQFMARCGHVLAGVTWIGLLYFFNFVQVPAYAELSDGARSEALRKLTFRACGGSGTPRALTFLFGIVLVGIYSSEENPNYFEGVSGTSILTGMLFGITMFLNVWGVIWRNQKIVIGNAETVAAGGEANPEAPAAAKRAARASRCNTLFSVTMLWFMVFTAHGPLVPSGRRHRRHCRLLAVHPRSSGGSSRRRRSASSVASTARSTSTPSTSTRTRSSPAFILLAVVWFIGWELLLPAPSRLS